MSSSRGSVSSTLFSVITDDLRTGKLTKMDLIIKTRNAIQRGITNRVFDDIPRLVDDKTLVTLGVAYLAILREASFSGEENLEPNMATKTQMEIWTKNLIKSGISELFDEKGNIKPGLVELFGWGDLCGKINKKELITAYVGAVTAQVQNHHNHLIVEHLSFNNGRVSNYISAHYSQWVDEVMPATSTFTYRNAATVAVAGILFGGVGAAVVTVGLFAATANAAPVNNSLDYNSPKP